MASDQLYVSLTNDYLFLRHCQYFSLFRRLDEKLSPVVLPCCESCHLV